jgi:hypothetical protein
MLGEATLKELLASSGSTSSAGFVITLDARQVFDVVKVPRMQARMKTLELKRRRKRTGR